MNGLFDIKGKVVVMTGACGVLGSTIVKYFASEGCKVVLLDLERAENIGYYLVSEIKAAGGEAMFLPTNVLDEAVLEQNLSDILAAYGMTIDDIDLFEHNEAFASASCAVKKTLNVPDEIFNVNGGAVALGHPIGCSGARVLTTLLYAMMDRQKDVGCATLCLGGGNAVTTIIRRE